MEELKMKLKKILAAIAACAMSAAMLGMTVSAAGVDGDGAEIVDEPEEEIEFEEEPEEEEPEEEPEQEEPEVEQPAASNPTTGNSPIALAVIPVALAAAAVVAKKASK